MNEYEAAENLRSDTIDVIRYTIDLDFTLMGQNLISGSCQVDFVSLMDNVELLHLDLQALTVDSVTSPDGLLEFTHTGSDLMISLPQALNTLEAYSVIVHYGGDPVTDPSWGGFYTTSLGFAFNIGVGFDSDPHTIGRMWFPCFDNFVERSEYDVRVLTNNGRTAYCGGVRLSVDTVGTDSLYTRWLLADHPIPSYLASVAVANYAHVDNSYETTLGQTIPVWLTARPQDTTAMKNSFVNLIDCLAGFEDRYGPYRWPRVGFVSVPFNAGAMEHATNIAYPSLAVNGNLTYETLIAHELSHHWWGDLVTCRTEEDMWLNEGWASYSEALFTELLYGEEAYDDYVRDNHKVVLTETHIDDGGRYPVSGVPHELTYSSTVYLKGSDIVHTLRGVMGDEAFFNACQSYLETYQFQDVNSEDLRDHFQQFTATDLTAFFTDWVFEPGFPELRIEDTQVAAGQTGWGLDLTIRQYQHYSTNHYERLPLKVTVMNSDYQTEEHLVEVNGQWTFLSLTTDIEPVHVILNRDQSINYAVLAEEQLIDDTGTSNLSYAEFDMSVENMGSATQFWIRAENHWAASQEPHLIPFTDFLISNDRWWNVQSDMPADAEVEATLRYYGDPGNAKYYDPLFFEEADDLGANENDLILLYRQNAQSEWTEWPTYTINTSGSVTNWIGRFNLTNVRAGHYAWGIRTGTVGVSLVDAPESEVLQVTYNTPDRISIRSSEGIIQIADLSGKIVYRQLSPGQLEVNTHSFVPGVYVIQRGSECLKFPIGQNR